MKTTDKDDRDEPLAALLREWKVKFPPPPRFTEEVWRRIDRAEPWPAPTVSLAEVIANWIATRLPRPALATAYLTVLLAVGASMGWRQGQQESNRVTRELSARYAQAVDPYRSTP